MNRRAPATLFDHLRTSRGRFSVRVDNRRVDFANEDVARAFAECVTEKGLGETVEVYRGRRRLTPGEESA